MERSKQGVQSRTRARRCIAEASETQRGELLHVGLQPTCMPSRHPLQRQYAAASDSDASVPCLGRVPMIADYHEDDMSCCGEKAWSR